MRIGCLYHSHTGNTDSVLKTLQAKLIDHTVVLAQIKAKTSDPSVADVTLTEVPSLEGYDAVIFASPVHGFNLPHVTQVFLAQLSELPDVPVMLLITHYFPFKWLGGHQGIKGFKKVLEPLGANIVLTQSIEWRSKHRTREIARFIDAVKKRLMADAHDDH